ncbi:MAG TPA: hypothetical protein VFY43_03320 [Candidatus Limnocylindria bacterium]|nr:hypothetical protein [Candidatus Limnocylindria bacterium]
MDELLDSWMDQGPTVAPSRIAEATRAEIRTIHQRRATSWPQATRWPVRRYPRMSKSVSVGLAAAAVLVVAIVGIRFLVPPANVTAPTSPTPVATPRALLPGALQAGTYVTHPAIFPNQSIGITFTVPDGWRAFDDRSLLPVGEGSSESPDGMALGFGLVSRLYSDPCHGTDNPDVAAGTSVDDLVAALSDNAAYVASAPTDVSLGGYSGKQLDLQLPSDIASCPNGEFFVWEGGPYAQGPNNRWHLSILKVEQTRVVILETDFAATPAADRAEMKAIVASIRFEAERDAGLLIPTDFATLAPGRYRMAGAGYGVFATGWPSEVSADVPAGWVQNGKSRGGGIRKSWQGEEAAELSMWRVGKVAVDGCGSQAEMPVGSSVDDLAAALAVGPGVAASAPIPAALGGFSGVRMDLTVPTELPGCDSFRLWVSIADTGGEAWTYASPQGWRHQIWILDVEGTRFLIDAASSPDAPEEFMLELQQMVESVGIQP